MLEFLQPVATVIGYLLLLPALAFATILFLSAAFFVLYWTLRWWSGARMRKAANTLMLEDLQAMKEAMPDSLDGLMDTSPSYDEEEMERIRGLVGELGEESKELIRGAVAKTINPKLTRDASGGP